MIWPDGVFMGFPEPDTPYNPHDFNEYPEYTYNSMPLLYMNLTLEGRKTTNCLFLIDSGAKADTFVKLSAFALQQSFCQRDQFRFNLKYPSTNPLSGIATGRVDAHNNVSPRENSVLGPAWMFTTFPLFVYSEEVPLKKRIAIYFPQNTNDKFLKVTVQLPGAVVAANVNMKLDTGAPYSTFPVDITKPRANSPPHKTINIFKWFDSERRNLFNNVTVRDADGRWAFSSSMTARTQKHGLLGMDFLLHVKPRIVYVDDNGIPFDLPGQKLGVDFLKENIMRYE
jgi:hypothetical protein